MRPIIIFNDLSCAFCFAWVNCPAKVMQMLRDIKAGKPIEPCTRAPAIGSYLHKKAASFHGFPLFCGSCEEG